MLILDYKISSKRIKSCHWVTDRFDSWDSYEEFGYMVDQREAELLGVTE